MLAKTFIALFANSSSLNLSFKPVPLAFISKPSPFFGLQMGQRAGPLVLYICLPDLTTRKILKAAVSCQHSLLLLPLSFIISELQRFIFSPTPQFVLDFVAN